MEMSWRPWGIHWAGNVGCNEPSSLSPLCTEIYTSHFISQNGTLFHQQKNEYFEQHSDSAYQPDVPFRL